MTQLSSQPCVVSSCTNSRVESSNRVKLGGTCRAESRDKVFASPSNSRLEGLKRDLKRVLGNSIGRKGYMSLAITLLFIPTLIMRNDKTRVPSVDLS